MPFASMTHSALCSRPRTHLLKLWPSCSAAADTFRPKYFREMSALLSAVSADLSFSFFHGRITMNRFSYVPVNRVPIGLLCEVLVRTRLSCVNESAVSRSVVLALFTVIVRESNLDGVLTSRRHPHY